MLYSGLHHLTHRQGFFKDNLEAESYYWPCQRHRKSCGKRELMRKVGKPGSQHFFCAKLVQWLWTKTFNPLGFDFLACQMREQHLSANLSGFWRSNRSKEMHFEEHSTLFRCKDDWDAASGKAFHLCASLDPPSTTEPRLHMDLLPTFPGSPTPSRRVRTPQQRLPEGCARCTLLIPS